MKTMLVRTTHTVHSRLPTMTTLIAFRSVCKLVQPPIMRHGLYSALLLGGFSLMSDTEQYR